MATATGRGNGAQSGAGHKSDPEIKKFRELVDSVVTREDWRAIVQAAVEDAQGHDRSAALARQWLTRYRFGLPMQTLPEETDTPQIKTFQIVRPPGAPPPPPEADSIYRDAGTNTAQD